MSPHPPRPNILLIPGNFTLDHLMPSLVEQVNLPVVIWAQPPYRSKAPVRPG